MPPYQIADIRQKQFADLNPDGAFVIICRYMSSAALDWIEASADRLAGVGLFLDDDIPAVIASRESTIGYKFSLLTKAILPLRRLNRQLDMVWVSTPRLAQTFGEVDVRLMPPAPPRTLWDIPHSGRQNADHAPILVAYHATGIHVQEHEFLRPVIAQVLSERPNAMFEVFAEGLAAYSWSKLARVTVRKPIPWASYVDEGRSRSIDIMLVPLAASHVNDCRSATKRIDVARTRAAGIFSASHAYGEADDSGEIRIPYDLGTWRQAILDLIDNPSKRASAAQATRSIVERMTADADEGILL
jgi:hypothetical protein